MDKFVDLLLKSPAWLLLVLLGLIALTVGSLGDGIDFPGVHNFHLIASDRRIILGTGGLLLLVGLITGLTAGVISIGTSRRGADQKRLPVEKVEMEGARRTNDHDDEIRWREFGIVGFGIGGQSERVVKHQLEDERTHTARLACLYDPRWRMAPWKELLEGFLSRPGTSLTVYVPNPDDDALITQLAKRHVKTNVQFKILVNQLLEHFMDLPNPEKVTLKKLNHYGPSYTAYLFTSRTSSTGVLRLYGHEMGSGTDTLPEFVAVPGLLLDYLFKDFERLDTHAEKVSLG